MRLRRHSDEGASLILVLIIVTVLSVTLGIVLDQTNTALRSTVVLRNQTSNNYGGDAAGQAVIAQLKAGKVACTTLTGTGQPVTLGASAALPFYNSQNTTQGPLNASATCIPDTVNGTTTIGTGQVTIDTTNTLGYAVLTVGTASPDQTYGTACISGGSVISNSGISASLLQVGLATSQTVCTLTTVTGINVQAASSTGCNGLLNDANTNDYNPTPCQGGQTPVPQTGTGGWGTLANAPSTAVSLVDPAPLCSKVGSTIYAAYRPGVYTNVTNLTSPSGTQCGSVDFAWFTPGTYYFDYGSTTWNWPTKLVAGFPQDGSGNPLTTLVGFNADPAAAGASANRTTLSTALAQVTAFPGSCADPALQSAYPGSEFVFGGTSTFKPSQSATNELCATYADGSPGNKIPIAIYGLSKDVDTSTVTVAGQTVHAGALCTGTPVAGCTTSSTDNSTAPFDSLIQFDSNGHNSAFIHGYVYAPDWPINFRIKNSKGILLGWGLVLRSLNVGTVGSSPKAPYIAYRPTLHQAQKTVYTVRYINVWTCVASSTPCPTTGNPTLRVKIQSTLDANGNITGNTVLSWSRLN